MMPETRRTATALSRAPVMPPKMKPFRKRCARLHARIPAAAARPPHPITIRRRRTHRGAAAPVAGSLQRAGDAALAGQRGLLDQRRRLCRQAEPWRRQLAQMTSQRADAHVDHHGLARACQQLPVSATSLSPAGGRWRTPAWPAWSRCVSGMPAQAPAPCAAVMPGTTSNGMPASARPGPPRRRGRR